MKKSFENDGIELGKENGKASEAATERAKSSNKVGDRTSHQEEA